MIDILMIAYNRPDYTRLSLKNLLDSCDDTMRVWIWQNGRDGATMEVVKELANHPRVYELYVSDENKKLNEPTNWFWEHATAEYLSKVDDDCLVPMGWAQTLKKAHIDNPRFGVLGCWRFLEEDFIPEMAFKKIKKFDGGHRLLVNCWVEGSGYLMKRACVESVGLLNLKKDKKYSWIKNAVIGIKNLYMQNTFNDYCIEIARRGWVNGWYYPFLYQEHMDDPRVPHTGLLTDEDFAKYMPLSAVNRKSLTLKTWTNALKDSARYLQYADTNPACYSKVHRGVRKILRKFEIIKDDNSGM